MRILTSILACCVVAACSAAMAEPPAQGRKPVARLFSPVGTLAVREQDKWTLPALYDALHAGDMLVALPGAKAVLDLKEGDVRLTMLGNLPELSPGTALESAVVLHVPGKDHDVDLALDRGRIMLESKKEKGTTVTRVRLGKEMIQLTLEKGSRVGLDRYSYWRPGVPFVKEPRADHAPEDVVVVLVVKGKVEVEFPSERRVLSEPVVFHWHLQGRIDGPTALKKMPEWFSPGSDTSAKAAAAHAAVEKLRRKLADKKDLSALPAVLKEKDDALRAVAVHSAGAADELAPVLSALTDAKSATLRAAAVMQLRHWVSRNKQHDRMLFDRLNNTKGYTAGEAEIVLGLLHTFGERDLAQPETYDALINYLGSERLALRELAHFHLLHLVPGRNIGFDAGADPEARAKAQAAWRKLIPEGKLPPRDK